MSGFINGMHRLSSGFSTECKAVLTSLKYNSCDGTEAVGAPNGCGSASGNVPDYFIGASGGGNIFTAACNVHDQCYSTLHSTRQACDVALGDSMRTVCLQIFDPTAVAWTTTPAGEVYELRSGCNLQAQAYETGLVSAMNQFKTWVQGRGLVWSFVAQALPSSEEAFQTAQHEAHCEYLKRKRENICGF